MQKVFGIVGRSGSGKTTLLEKLIPSFRERGLTISTIKHTHHAVDMDYPGKDSYRHRQAGAMETLLSSPTRWMLAHEISHSQMPTQEPDLQTLLSRLSPCDLVLVEGFKADTLPKLEVFRPSNGKPPLYLERNDIIAIASDALWDNMPQLPILPLEEPRLISEYILRFLEFP